MELYTKIIIIALLLVTLTVAPALSALTDSTVIESKGTISNVFAVTAESGYWQDIQNAVDQVNAQGGGTVYIPAGTFNFVNVGESWTDARVTIPAGVNVYGASNNRDANGQNTEWRTVLRLPWDVPSPSGTWWFKLGEGEGNSNEPSRFSDIKLVGYRYEDPSSTTMLHGIDVEGVIDFRVDHCFFQDICGGAIATWGGGVGGYGDVGCCGVIDHCKFINTNGYVTAMIADCTVSYGVQIGRSYGDYWDDDVTHVLGQYTRYTTFIEDCYFEKWRHCTSSNSGAHYVIRYCTIQNDFGYGAIDSHGWYQTSGGKITQVGTRATEIYGNTIIDAVQYYWGTAIRGGAGVAFNNVFGGGTFSSSNGYLMYLRNDMASTPEASKVWCNDWYIWDNTLLDGSSHLFTKYDDYNQIIEGENYFLHAPTTFTYTPYQYPHPLTTAA